MQTQIVNAYGCSCHFKAFTQHLLSNAGSTAISGATPGLISKETDKKLFSIYVQIVDPYYCLRTS